MIIKTAQGKEYPIVWAGTSIIDNALRFELISPNMAEVFAVFTNPTETNVIEYIIDNEVINRFVGYSEFTGLNMVGGNIIVALSEKRGDTNG